MKLAVKKEPGAIPGSGFHYMTFPMAMGEMGTVPEFFELMGYIIIEVPDERGKELLEQARAALKHQVEIAYIADKAERDKGK